MDFQEVLRSVSARPAIHGLDGSYTMMVAFVIGCDAASDGSLLLGFREWLVLEVDDGDNLSWQGLIELVCANSGNDDGGGVLDAKATCFADLLMRFLDQRNSPQGRRGIFVRYIDLVAVASMVPSGDARVGPTFGSWMSAERSFEASL